MAETEYFEKCPQCDGTGFHQSSHGPAANGSVPCNWPGCNGTGFISRGKFTLDPSTEDIAGKCEDILEKCSDILEKLNE